jgi:hypothetical protein
MHQRMSYAHQDVRCLRGFCLQELVLDDIIFDALKYYDAYRPDKLIELAGVCDCIRCALRGWRPMTYSQAGILHFAGEYGRELLLWDVSVQVAFGSKPPRKGPAGTHHSEPAAPASARERGRYAGFHNMYSFPL